MRFELPFLVFLLACAPTLSGTRNEKYTTALAEAEAHQHHGRYAEAAASFHRAAESTKQRIDRDEALYRESRVLARTGKFYEAILICDELAAAKTPGTRTERAKLDASRYRLEVGAVERAEQDLTALAKKSETGPGKSALHLLIQLHVDRATSHEEALTWVRTFGPTLGKSALRETLMFVEGELLVQMGRSAEAMTVFEKQVERYPYPKGLRWDNALWRLADLAIDAHEPKRALGYLERMVDVNESSLIVGSYTRALFPKAALRIARIYRDELHDTSAALSAYQEVRSEFPKSLVVDDALEEEAELRITNGDKARGCELLRELISLREVGGARKRAEERIERDCR